MSYHKAENFFYSLICCAFFCRKITLNDYTTSFCILHFLLHDYEALFPSIFWSPPPVRVYIIIELRMKKFFTLAVNENFFPHLNEVHLETFRNFPSMKSRSSSGEIHSSEECQIKISCSPFMLYFFFLINRCYF